MSYNYSALIKEFRKSSCIGEVDELSVIIDQGKNAYKNIFNKINKFITKYEEEYQELSDYWCDLLEKYSVSEKSTTSKKDDKNESESYDSDIVASDKIIQLKKNLDTSEFQDLEYMKNYTKEQLYKIFGEDKLAEYEHEDHIYYEWKLKFGEFFYSIYTSDLGDDVVWILAGNAKKNKKNVEMLYKTMNEILDSE